MRIFEEFPKDIKCPICGINKPGRCILIGLDSTEDGHNMQAIPVHLDCIGLRMKKIDEVETFIYQKFPDYSSIIKGDKE